MVGHLVFSGWTLLGKDRTKNDRQRADFGLLPRPPRSAAPGARRPRWRPEELPPDVEQVVE
jgi:hypothetical protein